MSEVERQEGQKTVVAFITGLLIGGLLVWVFSSAPEDKPKDEKKSTDTEQTEKKDVESKEDTSDEKSEDSSTKEKPKADVVVGKGTIAVTDQTAGNTVALGKLELPTKMGWVVVRDYKDGTGVGALGAALYDVDKGLIPASVPLMRATVKDSSYQVVFFTDNGDATFSFDNDEVIEGTMVTFKAN